MQEAGGTTARSGQEGSLLVEVAVALARRWRLVVGVTFLAGVAALVMVLLAHNTYRAETSFVPETRSRGSSAGALAGLAAAAGFSIGAGEPGQTPQFYADLLKSTPIMYGVLQAKFAGLDSGRTGARADSLSLVDYLQPGRDPLDVKLEQAARSLASMIVVSVDRPTGVVRLAVIADRPALAAAIANEFVRQLNAFNRGSRHTQARSRREFAEARIQDAARSLADAETALRAFYERNRQFQESPSLRFEEGRLKRQLDIRQDLYMSLSRELELSRINEADESPVITVIEPALVPTRKFGPNRRRTILGAVIVALGLVASWVVFYEMQREPLRDAAASLRARVVPLLPRPFGGPRGG